jgi:hypothetical protein
VAVAEERANNLKRSLEQGKIKKSLECTKWGNVKAGFPVYDKRKKTKKKKTEGEEESGEEEEEEEEEGGGFVDDEAEEGEEEGSESEEDTSTDDDDDGTRKKLLMEDESSKSEEDAKKEVGELCNSSVVAREREGGVGKISAREKRKAVKAGKDLAMKARIADREFYDTKRLEKRSLEVIGGVIRIAFLLCVVLFRSGGHLSLQSLKQR